MSKSSWDSPLVRSFGRENRIKTWHENPKKQKGKLQMRTVSDFFNWLMTKLEPAYVVRLRDEWQRLPYKVAEAMFLLYDASDWPALWDAYDERVAIMTEGREPADADLLKAWEDVLGIEIE